MKSVLIIIGLLSVLAILLVFLLLLVDNIIKCKKNDSTEGYKRFIRISEYNFERHRVIHTNSFYWLFENVVGTCMENKIVKFNIDNEGFVADTFNIGDPQMKISFVGDSVTELAIVDEANRFPCLVGRLLSNFTKKTVNAYNAGYSGACVYNLNVMLLTKIIPIKPKLCVMCSNIHDIKVIIQSKTYAQNFKQKYNVYEDKELYGSYTVRLKKVIRELVPFVYDKIYTIIHKKTKYEMSVCTYEIDNELINDIEEQYQRQLELFIEICNKNKIVPIIMTQASCFKIGSERLINIYKQQVCSDTVLSYDEFASIHKKLNQIVRVVSRKNDVILVDLDSELSNNESYIYDLVHFTDEGSKKCANMIFKEIIKTIMF